jgi:hypothetical protein
MKPAQAPGHAKLRTKIGSLAILGFSWIICGGPEKATRLRRGGGEWVPNKIPERNLACPKLTQRASLLTRSRPHNYRQAIGPRNRVRENEISAEAQTVQANPRQNYGEPKSDQQSFSQPHIHFIEHLTCLTEKPLEEHNEH